MATRRYRVGRKRLTYNQLAWHNFKHQAKRDARIVGRDIKRRITRHLRKANSTTMSRRPRRGLFSWW